MHTSIFCLPIAVFQFVCYIVWYMKKKLTKQELKQQRLIRLINQAKYEMLMNKQDPEMQKLLKKWFGI